MTRFFYDCEFVEDGHAIDLISIGIVRERDGAEYYAVSSEFSLAKLHMNKWLVENVLPGLPLRQHPPGMSCRCVHGHLDADHPDVRSLAQIAREVAGFLLSDGEPELWAWYGAYDHVCLMWLFGSMSDRPDGLPMWTNDLRQELGRLEKTLGRKIELPDQPDGGHNALADARHNLVRARYLDALTE